jgi:hypothetical protein
MPMIKLQSSDGEIIDVDVEAAKASNIIKAMIEGRDEDDDEPVPLLNVNGAIMKKVLSCHSPEIVSPQCSLAPFSFALHPSLGN